MHFAVLVTVDGATKEADIKAEVERLMAPFNECMEVEPYAIDPETAEYHDKWSVTLINALNWASRKKQAQLDGEPSYTFGAYEDMDVERTNLEWLVWYTGSDWRPEGDGYVEYSDYNPLSQWDGWMIGGRWDNFLNRIPNGFKENPPWGKTALFKGGSNILRRRDLRMPQSTFAYLTKEGEWHDRDKQEDDTWDKDMAEYLLTVPGEDWLVVVDCHI